MPEHVCIAALPPADREVIVHRYRYEMACRYAYGHVLDVCCGFGYGSAMLAEQDDVEGVTGIDRSETALWHARKLYKHPKLEFKQIDIETDSVLKETWHCDTLVTLETLEHLKHPRAFMHKIQCRRLVVSVPIIPTVGKNPHHQTDFTRDEVIDWLTGWNYQLIHEEIQNEIYLIAAFDRI